MRKAFAIALAALLLVALLATAAASAEVGPPLGWTTFDHRLDHGLGHDPLFWFGLGRRYPFGPNPYGYPYGGAPGPYGWQGTERPGPGPGGLPPAGFGPPMVDPYLFQRGR